MQDSRIEPGLLQVFRFYAWLRLVSLLLPFLGLWRHSDALGWRYYGWPLALVAGESLLLLGYLYWGRLERKTGHCYIPIALAFATIGLIIEQQFFTMQKAMWQVYPFLTILLILVAWQYSLRTVIAYILGSALLEALLSMIFPWQIVLVGPFSEPDLFIPYALQASRTLALLLIGYVVNSLVKAARQQRQALAEANQRLVSHAATLEQLAVSRERLRLSRELHDTLAHTLSALAVQIDAILTVWQGIPSRAQAMLERALDSTRSGLDETRRALSALRASPLEELGLAMAVRCLVEDFATRHSLALGLDIAEEMDGLSPEAEQCFYRVAQETLENIALHANAHKLTVKLQQTQSNWQLSISDDGKGFAVEEFSREEFSGNEKQRLRLGIKGMQERAEMIGAALTIESQLEQGTVVQLILERRS